MERVVHVLDPVATSHGASARGAPCIALLACSAAIAATPELAHLVVVLGTGGEASRVERAGLRPHAVVPVPAGRTALAWRGMRRAFRSGAACDVVQPWSDRARTACRVVERAPAGTPTGLLPSFDGAAARTREEIRARHGLGPDVPLVGLLAEPSWYADARRFVFMIGLLDVAGIPVAGLVGSATAHVARARRFYTRAGVRWRMLLPEAPIGAVLHACDLGVIVPPNPHRALSPWEREWVRWSVLRAHLLGVPVLGAWEWLDGTACAEEARLALHARGDSLTDIGRRLARLAGDAGERARVSRGVREHANSVADQERFARALREHWGVARRDSGTERAGSSLAGVAR